MLTTTIPFRPTNRRARFTNEMCPACRYPIVGTKPIRAPLRLQASALRCIPFRLVMTRTD